MLPIVAKEVTRAEAERKKAQAAEFMERIGEADRAEEFDDMSVEEYAEGRGLRLSNPTRRSRMARKTAEDYRDEVKDLKQQIRDLEDENSSLNEKLDTIADALEPEPEEGEIESEDESDDQEED